MGKGTGYENEVADAIEAELAQGNFGIDPALARVRRKPSYFSQDRQKDIVFDVSVEVSRRGVSDPYWIWVWECKDYAQKVPVDDAEEFHAKLSQIGADRTKGTMITPVGYDSGTVAFAKANGIGLWRFVPSGSIVSLIEDSGGAANADILCGLTIADAARFQCYGGFYGLATDGRLTTSREELLHWEFKDAV